MRKLTIDDFIKISNDRHNHKYDYSMTIYINSQSRVDILCKEHGMFRQLANAHMRGQGCPKCNGGVKYETIDFIKKGNKVHNGYYDYSKSKYVDNFTKLTIVCPIHGDFDQLSSNHLSGQGCPKCYGRYLTNDEFINNCKEIHNNKYDYSEVKYKGSNSKVKIKCKEHGVFIQRALNHLKLKQGCPKCKGVDKSNTEDFIKKSIRVHGLLYDYKNTVYKNAKTNVTIICKKHGPFEQSPTKHLMSQGCPICKLSKGELKIISILNKHNVKYRTQHKFKELNLKFDFYIKEYNLAIEYDGIQHFKPINHFGGIKSFEEQKIRDRIKDEYCYSRNIRLLRIPYFTIDIEKYIIDHLY